MNNELVSKELDNFKKHFEHYTNIKTVNTIEESTFFHWKRLCFNSLNCEQLIIIGDYIKKWFTVDGKYYHMSPKFSVYNGYLTLTVDVEYLDRFNIKI